MLQFLARLVPRRFRSDIPVVPVVRFSGVIGVVTPLRPGLMLSTVARTLERAFETPRARAVALVINSPGGSPSQSHLIYRRIRQLADEKHLPVLAFVEDVGASGGYMLACAADEIICDQYSIVGSIGVVGGTFGFTKLMDKLGIERRLYTAGDRKVMLDPFLPEKQEDVQWLRGLQDELHEMFRRWVTDRRGDKLKGGEELFTGEVWTGARALEYGLIDGLGTPRGVLAERFPDAELVPVEGRKPLLARLGIGAPAAAGADLVLGMAQAADIRATWARYGL